MMVKQAKNPGKPKTGHRPKAEEPAGKKRQTHIAASVIYGGVVYTCSGKAARRVAYCPLLPLLHYQNRNFKAHAQLAIFLFGSAALPVTRH
jgi:hypothetical protein